MGIRFRCHHCEHELNLKEFQAGRRARCPACGGKFRVPTQTADFSVPLEDAEIALAGSVAQGSTRQSHGSGTFELKPSSHDAEAALPAKDRRAKAGASADRPNKSNATHAATESASQTPKTPAAIAEAPDAIWYVRPPSGGQYGPADAPVFLTWLQDHRVSADSLVWRDGWPQWMLAGEAFEDFFGSSWRLAATPAEEPNSSWTGQGSDEPDNASQGAPSQPLSAPSAAESVLPAKANAVQARRQKQRANYVIFIAVLAILAIGLAVVLARVLLK